MSSITSGQPTEPAEHSYPRRHRNCVDSWIGACASNGWQTIEEGDTQLLVRFEPELIVVEEPLIYHSYEEMPGALLLRQTFKAHPERFERVKVLPIESNHVSFRGHELWIYRNRLRNPNRRPHAPREETSSRGA